MRVQIVEVEQVEFSEAELENLEFTPEELEAIEEERVPDLESISVEDVAENLQASLEMDPGTASTGQTRAMSSPGYIARQNELNRLAQQLLRMNRLDPRRRRIERLIQNLQGEMNAIIRNYQGVAAQIQSQRPRTPSPSASGSSTSERGREALLLCSCEFICYAGRN